MQTSVAPPVLLCDKGKCEKGRKRSSVDAVIHLQVLLQPLVLLKEEVQSELQIEVNLGGERDHVHWAQVPAVDTHHIT